jgi:hypothetical protein
MRLFRLVGTLFAVLAFSTVVVAVASAAETLWRWNPGTTGATFTGSSGKVTLQVKGGAAITCEKSALKGSLTSEQTLGVGTVTVTICTLTGLAVLGLGDTAQTVTLHGAFHDCLISSGDAGLLIKLSEPVHVEVPSTGLLMVFTGSLLVLALPNKSKKTGPFPLNAAQTAGVQAIEKCEGGTAQKLEASTDGSANVQTGAEMKEASITWAAAEEIVV